MSGIERKVILFTPQHRPGRLQPNPFDVVMGLEAYTGARGTMTPDERRHWTTPRAQSSTVKMRPKHAA